MAENQPDQQQPVEGIETIPVQVIRSEETHGMIWLEDGNRLHVRTMVHTVERVPGRFNPDGSPVYNIVHGTIVTAKPPKGEQRFVGGR